MPLYPFTPWRAFSLLPRLEDTINTLVNTTASSGRCVVMSEGSYIPSHKAIFQSVLLCTFGHDFLITGLLTQGFWLPRMTRQEGTDLWRVLFHQYSEAPWDWSDSSVVEWKERLLFHPLRREQHGWDLWWGAWGHLESTSSSVASGSLVWVLAH